MRLGYFLRFLARIAKKWFGTSQKPFVYVALGDSTTEGVGASHPSKSFPYLVYKAIKKELGKVEHYNFGKKHSKIRNVLQTQLPKTLKLQPDLVTISIGYNDAARKIGTKKFRKDFQTLLKTLSEQTSAIIAVNNLPDLSIATAIPMLLKAYVKMKAKKINEILKQETQASGGIYVDLHAQSKLLTKYKDLLADDGLHPSDMGHAIWGSTIVSHIKPAILEKHKPR